MWNKKIAITWSSWFVWSYLVKYFSKLNFEVMSFNRQNWDLKEKYNWIFDCDIFIHWASDTSYEKSKKEMIKNNVEINKNVLEIVNNSNCKHFIYISSSSVYQWISWKISAKTKINKNNLKNSYSLTKFLAEEYIKENLNKNIKLTILRPRAIYWKWDKVLVPNILKNQIFWYLILPWNWKTKTSISQINDFVNFIWKIILSTDGFNHLNIYNFSSEIRTYNQLFLEISEKYKLKWIIHTPLFIFKILKIFNENKYSYILDTFWNDKILK
jgi:nucleoside-diphosphate-sugar epimerase